MKKYLFIALAIACVFSLCGCITFEIDDDTSAEVSKVVENEDISKNDNVFEGEAESEADISNSVSVEWETTLERDVCIFLTNGSNKVIPHVSGQVLYKDSAGETVDVAEFNFYEVLSGAKVVSCAFAYEVTDEWETYDVTYSIDMDWDVGDTNYADKCVVNAHEGDGNIIVEITNNAGVKLDEVDYVVMFYLGDDISWMVKPSIEGNISIEKDSTYTGEAELLGREYDRYEVYLNEAIAW